MTKCSSKYTNISNVFIFLLIDTLSHGFANEDPGFTMLSEKQNEYRTMRTIQTEKNHKAKNKRSIIKA